jgi:hypothetical protein
LSHKLVWETLVTHQEIDRIRFVTGHFRLLQGLRTVLFAGWLLVLFGSSLLCSLPWLFLPFGLSCVAYHFLSRRIDRYYRERFGEIQSRPAERQRLDSRIAALLVLAAWLLLGLAKSWIPGWIESRPLYLTVGAILMGQWLRLGRPATLAHRALLGGFLLALAPLSVFAVPAWGFQGAVISATLALCGLLDHRQLELAMGPCRGVLGEAAPAAEGEA